MRIEHGMIIYLDIVFPVISEQQCYRRIGSEIPGIHIAPDVCNGIDSRLLVQVFPRDAVRKQLQHYIFQYCPVRLRIRPH